MNLKSVKLIHKWMNKNKSRGAEARADGPTSEGRQGRVSGVRGHPEDLHAACEHDQWTQQWGEGMC